MLDARKGDPFASACVLPDIVVILFFANSVNLALILITTRDPGLIIVKSFSALLHSEYGSYLIGWITDFRAAPYLYLFAQVAVPTICTVQRLRQPGFALHSGTRTLSGRYWDPYQSACASASPFNCSSGTFPLHS